MSRKELENDAYQYAFDHAYMNEFVHDCEVDDILDTYKQTYLAGAQKIIDIIKEKLDHFRYPEVGEMTDEFDELIMKLEGNE